MYTLHALEFNLFMPLYTHYYMNQTKPGQGCLWCCVALVVCFPGTLWCHLTSGTGCCGVAEMFTQGWHIWHSPRSCPWKWEKMALSTQHLWVSGWIHPLLLGLFSLSFEQEQWAWFFLPTDITLCDPLDVSSHVEEKHMMCAPFQCSHHTNNK